jgi:hypothetical protein
MGPISSLWRRLTIAFEMVCIPSEAQCLGKSFLRHHGEARRATTKNGSRRSRKLLGSVVVDESEIARNFI